MWLVLVPSLIAVASALQPLPPVEWTKLNSEHGGFDIATVDRNIYITNSFASDRDEHGLTLIPPSAIEFADTFRQDLEEITGESWDLHSIEEFPEGETGIFLDRLDPSQGVLTYENGDPTEEGYKLQVQPGRVSILGSGSRGMWWGTRTLLQQLLIAHNHPIPSGQLVDAPSYVTRGYSLDAGRKWYSPSFLKDLCTYASFFKMSEFQYHTSDNYPLNRGHNETWQDVYAQFSLRPESPDLQGIIQRPNETLSQADFEDLQQHCAQRGVTIIPEIEAPGHSLYITKWKPELALEHKDLLNLSHPDTIPLVKSIWTEFLPWFQTKEVHVGADEYDSKLADVYIDFVNEMAEFIDEEADKKIRIWGTHEPSDTRNISTDVIIQHWQYGQSDPVELAEQGYEVINSQDWWAYMSLKNDHMPIFPAPYPAFFNNSRVLNFANKEGWQWTPALFNHVNVTEQPDPKPVKGAILAAWNDNGPDATTQLEAYYAMRNGIPVVGARAWTGNRGPRIDVPALATSMHLLTSKAVAQNLDRQFLDEDISCSDKHAHGLLHWAKNSEFGDSEKIHLGYGSKGMNYELTLSVSGPFTLSSEDSTLALSPDGTLAFVSDGWEYPLRSIDETDGFDEGYPGRIWANETSSTHEPVTIPLQSHLSIRTDMIGGSRVWVNEEFVGRFEVLVFGGKNTLFSWSQMAFVAPLEWVEGGIQRLTVNDLQDVQKSSFNNLVTFGDSYTDDTRVAYFYAHNGSAPPVGWKQPEANSSASGGYIWGHFVASATNATRYNYAVSGGACSNKITPRTMSGLNMPYPSVLEYEIPAFLADSRYVDAQGNRFLDIPADETVYAIWIGTNDLGNYAFLTDSQVRGKVIPDYVECVYQALDRIYESGGRYFVLMNLAPLQLTPQYALPQNGGVTTVSWWPDKPDNQTLISYRMWEQVVNVNEAFRYRTPFEVLVAERYPEAGVAVMDMYGLLSNIYYNPDDWFGDVGANVTGFIKHCNAEGKDCVRLPGEENFMWFDELHPSETTDKFIAQEFVKVVNGESKWATYW
ncbi:glycoside hydrolase superfamily [Aspergillus bertholletiae]|uniref:beta-N-acetylhexosaminidase n=1 Tax=Aspergillus bertholletiae TaxID=1226010 RepID=A0A5N7BNV0_9EURO|nr:glycoside hydrolase superfamily [Aspergillus bertholletiae]